MVSAAAKAIIEDMRSQMGGPLPSLEDERLGWEAAVKGDRLPEGTLVSGVALNGVPCEWVERADSDREVVLMIHGGGFNAGSPRTHRKLAATFARLTGRRVLVPDYRLAPEEPFPAGLDDVVAVYAALVEDGVAPADIAFVGDSAGGGLVVAAAMKLKELGAPMPAALVTMSGWMDLTLTAGSIERNRDGPGPTRADLERSAHWYIGDGDRHDPLVSPVFADLSGLPRILIQAAGNDQLLDDSTTLAERAEQMGVDVTLSVAEAMWHVFQMADCPEARAAVEEAAAFVNNGRAADAD
jgi:monoterpene epsilon-lactone hydrolase